MEDSLYVLEDETSFDYGGIYDPEVFLKKILNSDDDEFAHFLGEYRS
jgi:hypothetical protein